MRPTYDIQFIALACAELAQTRRGSDDAPAVGRREVPQQLADQVIKVGLAFEREEREVRADLAELEQVVTATLIESARQVLTDALSALKRRLDAVQPELVTVHPLLADDPAAAESTRQSLKAAIEAREECHAASRCLTALEYPAEALPPDDLHDAQLRLLLSGAWPLAAYCTRQAADLPSKVADCHWWLDAMPVRLETDVVEDQPAITDEEQRSLIASLLHARPFDVRYQPPSSLCDSSGEGHGDRVDGPSVTASPIDLADSGFGRLLKRLPRLSTCDSLVLVETSPATAPALQAAIAGSEGPAKEYTRIKEGPWMPFGNSLELQVNRYVRRGRVSQGEFVGIRLSRPAANPKVALDLSTPEAVAVYDLHGEPLTRIELERQQGCWEAVLPPRSHYVVVVKGSPTIARIDARQGR